MNVRFAEQQDIMRIAEIYNHSIDDTLKSSAQTTTTYRERLRWFESRDDRYKVMAVCDGEKVVGFGSLERFSARYCYNFVAELAIYVEPIYRGKGYAKALAKKLIKVAESVGFYKLIVTLFDINQPAINLYKSFGFETVGVYENMGYYKGSLQDAIIFSKDLPLKKDVVQNYYENNN